MERRNICVRCDEPRRYGSIDPERCDRCVRQMNREGATK
jgi:hypothetical protein